MRWHVSKNKNMNGNVRKVIQKFHEENSDYVDNKDELCVNIIDN